MYSLMKARLDFHVKAKRLGDGKDILVATPTHVHADDVVFGQFRRDLHHMGQRVRRLKRGNDPFKLAAELESLKRFDIGDRHILRATDVMQP